MKKEGYYSSGAFAKMAHITKKTLRYYDEHNYLKPSYLTPSGARFYTDEDLGKLQQILLFKFLGFSLDDIKEIFLSSRDDTKKEVLALQLRLMENRIEQMNLVREVLQNTIRESDQGKEPNWSELFHKIDITGLENSLKMQYRNASNISARIRLHRDYSTNKQGWFPWIYDMAQLGAEGSVLEVGCGDGSLWRDNRDRISPSLQITLTDLSKGMLREVKDSLEGKFTFREADICKLPFEVESFDVVFANHVLFYAKDMDKAVEELWRVLKPGGTLVCSTYGTRHMKEISELVSEFDDRIVLAAESLYELFGKENGAQILGKKFREVCWKEYEDSLVVDNPEVLVAYIYSCHGNQNQYLLDKNKEFLAFVTEKTKKSLQITKEAGVFLAKKS